MLAICHIVHNHLLNAIILTWVDYTLDLPCGIIAQIIWHFNFIVCLHGLHQPFMIIHTIIHHQAKLLTDIDKPKGPEKLRRYAPSKGEEREEEK